MPATWRADNPGMNTTIPATTSVTPVLLALLGHTASAYVVRMRPRDRIAAVEVVWGAFRQLRHEGETLEAVCARVSASVFLARAGELLNSA